jgi:hypothetical protein
VSWLILIERIDRHFCLSEAFFGFIEEPICIALGLR